MASAVRVSMSAETEQKRKAQQKQLRQIEQLKQKSDLDAEVQKKLPSEEEIRKEIVMIASLKSGKVEVQGDKLSLFEEIAAALADIPSHAALFLGASEKPFREHLKSLRSLLKLRGSEKLDVLQQAKLDKLTEEAPARLRDFLPLKAKALSLASGCSPDQIEDVKAERGAAAAARALARKSEEQQIETPASPSAPPAPPPRIGIDVGGCLNKYLNDLSSKEADAWELSKESAAPGAVEALVEIVKAFGAENTYILSKCSGEMQRKTETWLFKTLAICKPEIGMLRKNVHFCPQRYGPKGKGGTAKRLRLNLSHFVDDRDDCLWSVYEEGDSKSAIDRHNGKFFHMARGANKRYPPEPKEWLHERPDCVVAVRNWSEVLKHLSIAFRSHM
eukprot:TRINITY_DN40606_c0_g1_i1.p1 TRINITY_DN40606_c0_g1~~TRINITY_DN40606_c0_g1_i1.p1  ORF type:complete len:421 (+),score=103.65 TRINITY_DN40606_c0_g1_i1:99-1265(+)